VRAADGAFARDLWDAEAVLAAPGFALAPDRVVIRNGLGSALVALSPAAGSPDAVLTATAGALQATRTLASLASQAPAAASGTLAGPVAEWGGIVHVTGSVTVPAGVTLRVLPGALVLVDGVLTGEGQPGECESAAQTPSRCGASITVRGAIESLGTAEEPVTFTAFDPARAWGQIHHDGASPSLYRHTFLTRGGNSPRGGHSNTGPIVRATDSTIRFEGSVLADTAGKSMRSDGSDLEFVECLLTRSIMGPEIGGTALLFDRSYAMEFHGTDDNDGIYLHGQEAGQEITLRESVFADGDDDGIDTLDSTVTIEDTIVRDWNGVDLDTKGISVFSGEVALRRCVLSGNAIGLSAKGQSSGATVRIDRTTIAGNQIGIQAEDKFGEPDLRILFEVTSSIIRGPEAVVTEYPQFPGDIEIAYTNLSAPWPGDGNSTSDPLFANAAEHDYRLDALSPCIDAGDPAAPPDPDGTRADMGAYPFVQGSAEPAFLRGRVNADESVDLSDAVALLLHLFGGGKSVSCEDAADADDSGALDITDAVFLLDHLFRGGAAPPPPAEACGLDLTADALDCAAAACAP
jgi:hypothetical protein